MSDLKRIVARLGKSGVVFTIALILFVGLYWANLSLFLLLDLCVLVASGAVLLFRASRFVTRHSLWSLRNRLLFVYGMFGFVPVVLLFILFGLVAWSFMSELAIYLANSALDRRLDRIQQALDTARRVPETDRHTWLPQIQRAFAESLSGLTLYVHDASGTSSWPPDSAPLNVPPGWKNVHGLLVYNHHLYGWAHYIDAKQEITALSPLSDELVANLVPNLGVIALAETEKVDGSDGFIVGSLNVGESPHGFNPFGGDVPNPVSRFDVPIALLAAQEHYHLDQPGQIHNMLLWVHSRPSAVLHAFFYDRDFTRGILADLLIGVAVLFLFVEMAALAIGISLSRRITRSVNALYHGTQQVISGDFKVRIPVNNSDQLGDLAESFNQMTGHLDRLLASEKERERLQAELEIAREVQSQLYPRGEAPHAGLHLTARCDPARMVSGDYYDYALLEPSKLAFAIGDVAGKGISAALLMATIQAALRAQVAHTPQTPNACGPTPEIDSASLVSSLNQQVFAHTAPEKYATFFFGQFDDTTRTLTYTNAGHLSPLLFRNGSVVPLDTNGMVIGAFPWAQYDESCIAMEHGDLLVCYTDGITEPENAYGEMFGEERLIELVKKHQAADDAEIIRIVFEAVRSWTGASELFDDMTLLLARQVIAA